MEANPVLKKKYFDAEPNRFFCTASSVMPSPFVVDGWEKCHTFPGSS